ncbi:hypothetical protein ELH80_33620 [Rhizobium ruizarguesonis]|jgi:hypothetical protein|uniref:Uncharacterized protein n=1 Tax=Rhizobium ruizarguesonis TaxID=2081791 RepID=A0AAE5C297_9HYPH|nr:hypothetical protein [Rhizobium ruizarguesonis]NEI50353.1 hypothetical protein [Rhizobium ruizarguesonis]TAY70476.1 hypothetical protein ELH86_30885 [Rhizobium ruizarguesonis]TAZ24857.1 hypothetical protein ELH80_33620 [Rhizobium ruizarguesonis]TBA56359.1 hypothetical protein ELH58_32550 [Rhizobium ruizarguesonis]TBB19335.1 hypothetical protein ELH47_34085 [Rhizobium ruizarguesonis]
MRALFILLLMVVGGVAYGYWDAYVGRPVYVPVTARVITPWNMYFDSAVPDEDNGQIYAEVFWEQPKDPSLRVSSIRIRGDVLDNGQKITSFDMPCKRAGSTWLADAKWTYQGNENTALLCFAKLDYMSKPDTSDKALNMDTAEAKIANMRLSYTADVNAVSRPMRYVTWINEQAVNIQDALAAPFQRQ